MRKKVGSLLFCPIFQISPFQSLFLRVCVCLALLNWRGESSLEVMLIPHGGMQGIAGGLCDT